MTAGALRPGDEVAPWLILSVAILSEVAATLALKAALADPALFVVVAVGYAAAFALLATCLRLGMRIGVVYGIWGAGGVSLTAVLSAAVFNEPLTAVMGLGIALIVTGVCAVALGSQEAQQQAPQQARQRTPG